MEKYKSGKGKNENKIYQKPPSELNLASPIKYILNAKID